MKPLATWSPRRILAAGAVWVTAILLVFLALNEWYVRRTVARLQAEAMAEAAARARTEGKRVAVLPPQREDIYVITPRETLLAVAGLALLPPLAAVVAWAVERRGPGVRPT